jgi:hypothetical protein
VYHAFEPDFESHETAQTDDSEDEMVTSRILFYATYDTTMDFADLIKSHALGANVAYVSGQSDIKFSNAGVLTGTAIGSPCKAIPQNGRSATIANGRVGIDRHPKVDI